MAIEEPSGDPMREVTPLLIEVQSNLDQELSLESLARQYGYSPYHFHRFFSRAIGETPKRHVERLRLERGAYKLAITDETVLGVALSVGFANHETFTRAFRRAFGCSPRDYRRACKAAQDEWSQRKRGFSGEGCSLSEVRFVSLPAMPDDGPHVEGSDVHPDEQNPDSPYAAENGWIVENDPNWPFVDALTRDDVLPTEDAREPWRELAADEERRLILDELRTFPTEQRRAFALHVLEGWDCDDIASAQGRSAEDVRRDIESVRRRLRERLVEH